MNNSLYMYDTVITHIRALFNAHQELAKLLPNEAFAQKLNMPSNTIGEQFWCLIGARESYTKALQENGWAGFSCSLPKENSADKQKIITTLNQTMQNFEKLISEIKWTDNRENFLIDLLEHESQHQGQLIRYVYGLKYTFPESWAKRWALDE